MPNSTFYFIPAQVRCPQCKVVNPAVEHGDDLLRSMDFVCQNCGYEEISLVKQFYNRNQETMKGGSYGA